ncbi:ABC transporter permease [Candidatus Puniceispirillum sp.]|nr:ABC transporter permease [Candidatus Puniceispirillum sp.]
MPAVINRHIVQSRQETMINSLTTLTALLFGLPALLGLIGIALPAFGYFPALNKTSLSGDAIRQFLATPGLWQASWLSLKTGLIATGASLCGCFVILATSSSSSMMAKQRRLLGPLVAIPHSTIAVGIVFLLAPSGWLMRLISPSLTGLNEPPIWGFVPDTFGFALILGLIAKELPFLLLLALSASATLPLPRLLAIGAGLGYGQFTSWAFIVLPIIYRQIRLPIIVVLVFSLSVVDMALLLAPSLPPPLAVLVLNGFHDADLAARLPASCGALWQIGLVLIALLLWRLCERLVGAAIQFCRWRGWRGLLADHFLGFLSMIAILPMLIGVMGLLAALIWSVANGWFFPAAFPASFSLLHWQDIASYLPLVSNSFLLAICAAFFSVMVVFLWLYHGRGQIQQNQFLQAAIYLPLLVPQISFLFGLQIGLSWAGIDGSWPALIYIHMIFILPYIWLILAPAFGKMDRRHDHVASSLGLGPIRRFLRVHLPLLAMPISAALFIGIAVSIALYLPTIFVSGGRISTITVEAVSLAANGSRGPAGVATMLQLLIPLICFGVIWLFLKYRFGGLTNMQGGK